MEIGPIAGWPPHKSVEDSLHVIRNVLNGAESYAICEKENGKAIGAIELILNGHTDMTDRDDECELGYWLGQRSGAEVFQAETAEQGLDSLEAFVKECGLPTKLGELHSKVESTDDVLHQVADNRNIIKCNPRWLDRQDIYQILCGVNNVF